MEDSVWRYSAFYQRLLIIYLTTSTNYFDFREIENDFVHEELLADTSLQNDVSLDRDETLKHFYVEM